MIIEIAGCPVHICSSVELSDLTIDAGGKSFRFEYSRMFGPMMLGKRGDPITTFPRLRSPFWPAVQAWERQGRRVDDDGRCIYDAEP